MNCGFRFLILCTLLFSLLHAGFGAKHGGTRGKKRKSLENGLVVTEKIYIPEALDFQDELEATMAPTHEPTESPTQVPTVAPTIAATSAPTAITSAPTESTTSAPTTAPTAAITSAPTTAPTAAPTLAPSTSPVPTTAPTAAPSAVPTSAVPSATPTAIPSATPSETPTQQPITSKPSARPTASPTTASPILTFSSNLTLAGLTSTTLSTGDQNSVINATATSMKISMNYVHYTKTVALNTGTKPAVSLKVIHLSSTSSVISITTTSLPTGSQNPTALYQSLNSSLNKAVSSGAFTKSLQSAAAVYGGTVVASANCTGVSNSAPVIVNPSSGGSSNNDSLSGGAIAGIVIGVLAFVVLLCGSSYYYFYVMQRGAASPLLETIRSDAKSSNSHDRKADAFDINL